MKYRLILASLNGLPLWWAIRIIEELPKEKLC